jgi:hypothetical protein
MPQLSRPAALALTACAALLLSACTTTTPIVLPEPEPSATPVFATDEEALAAAEAAYGAYLEASDAITAKNGEDPDTITPLVHPDYLEEVLEGLVDLRDNKLHSSGAIHFDSVTLQQYEDDLANPATISIYACADASDARLLNERDEDVTPIDRANRIPLEIYFETQDRLPKLLIKSSDFWSGADFCEN